MSRLTPARVDPPLPTTRTPIARVLPIALAAALIPLVAAAVAISMGSQAPLLLVMIAIGAPVLTWPLVGAMLSRQRGRMHLVTGGDHVVVAPVRVVSLALAAAPLVAALAIPAGIIDLGRGVGTGWSVVAVLVGALALPDAVRQVTGRRRFGLLLSPDGAQKPGEPVVPWADVSPVRLETEPGPRISFGAGTSVGPRLLATDPELLRRLLEHYAQHPRDRAELADGGVLDRVTRGDF